MNKQLLDKQDSGNFEIRLTSETVKLADSTEFTQYTVSRLHKTRVSSYGDSVKTYKRLETARKNFDMFTKVEA